MWTPTPSFNSAPPQIPDTQWPGMSNVLMADLSLAKLALILDMEFSYSTARRVRRRPSGKALGS